MTILVSKAVSESIQRITGVQQCGLRPDVDLSTCNGCGGCIDIAPKIFRFNDAFGFVEVVDLDYYDPDLVKEAIKNCPKNSISCGGE